MNKKTIFVTVGTQLPFPRIFDYVHEWSNSTDIPHQIYAQIAETDIKYPFHETRKYLSSDEFSAWFSQADCIVAHAGMGTIIESSINAKPLIIVPREAKLGEHRNDHQNDTARKFERLSNVGIARSKDDVFLMLSSVFSNNEMFHEKLEGRLSGDLGERLDAWIKERN